MVLGVAYGVIIALIAVLAVQEAARAQGANASPRRPLPKTAAQVYTEACASCHGTDGAGALPSHVAFDVELPDFTDCNFATREPNTDWYSVAHQGGPTRAFDEMMPAFGDALSEQELHKALQHVRTFCDDDAWPRGELNLPRALLTEKAYVEDEAVLELGTTLDRPVEVDGTIVFETRLGARGQFELVVPFGVREREKGEWGPEDEGGVSEGIGDIALGGKYVLVHSLDAGSIFSAAGEIFLPTGDELDGYGKGTFAFEPFLAYGQIIPVVGFVQLQGGAELPFETSRGEIEIFGRGAFGKTFRPGRFGRMISPMVEISGKGAVEEGATIDWTFVPQIQVALSKRQHVLWNIGLALPLNDLENRDYTLLTYILWDWFDGGFFEGW
jgi:hypothetical protein